MERGVEVDEILFHSLVVEDTSVAKQFDLRRNAEQIRAEICDLVLERETCE